MKKGRKLVALAMAMSLLCGAFALPAGALLEGEKTSGDYDYVVQADGTAEITRYTGAAKTLQIPTQLGGHTVTSIGSRAFDKCDLESVTIGKNVKEIKDHAFARCKSLTSVTCLNGLKKIGRSAFTRCDALATVKLPNSVTEIGNFAFCYCFALKDITFSQNVKELSNGLFQATALTSFVVPDGVTRIVSSFTACTALTSITIPDSVTKIEGWTFMGCEKLKDVYYAGTTAQWKKIAIEDYESCEELKRATFHYNAKEAYTSNKTTTADSKGKSVKNGVATKKGKTVLYKNGKQVTGTTLATVGGKTYAVKKGVVQKASKKASYKLVKLGKKSYIVGVKGAVQKSKSAKTGKLFKVGKKRYIVNKKGVVQTAKKKYLLVKAGKHKYIVNKSGVVQVNKKKIKLGKAVYKTGKTGIAKKKKQEETTTPFWIDRE